MFLDGRKLTSLLLLTVVCQPIVVCQLVVAQDVSYGQLQLKSIAKVGTGRVEPGRILIIQASVANSGSASSEGILVATVDGVRDQQNARRVVVEPQSTEAVDVYIQLPSSIRGKEAVEVTVALMSETASGEVMVDFAGQPAEQKLLLGVSRSPNMAATVMDPEPEAQPWWHWPLASPHSSYELAIASRIDSGNSRQMVGFESQTPPVLDADWSTLDLTVIANPDAFNDAAFVEAFKRYLCDGGRAWIMLDRVPAEALRPLLSAGQTCEEIDEIELNDFTVDLSEGNAAIAGVDRKVASGTPLRMIRVLQTGGRVSHSVNGWPAAIWMPVGYGELLITTLDGAGWIETRESNLSDPLFQSAFKMRTWGNQLAADVNVARNAQPLQNPTDYPLKRIGNPVVPRAWVAIALTAFCALIGSVGVWRLWVGELSLIGFFAPVLAILTSCILLVAGAYVRQEIPESVSTLQFVQVGNGGNFALVREQAAVHLDRPAEMSLEGEVDGRASADESVSSGVRRFEMEDFQRWRLTNEAWPPGAWRYGAQYSIDTEGLFIEAELTAQGIRMQVPDLPSVIEDPVLSFVPGEPMLCAKTGDGFVADGSLAAEGDRWIAGTLISDEQQRRIEVFSELFHSSQQTRYLDRVLLGWTSRWETGPSWNKELTNVGAALVTLPIHLQRPTVGQEIFVPHGLVRLRQDPSQISKTAAFNERQGKWASELTMTMDARLQLVLPQELLPFRASAIELELDVKAPQRTVRLISNSQGAEPVTLVTLESPSIPWEATLTNPSILEDASDGVIEIALSVSDRNDVEDAASRSSIVPWEVDHLRASLRGQVGESSTFRSQR